MKLLRHFLLVMTVLAVCFSVSHAGEELSLADALKKGLENNFQIRIARRNVNIAENNNSWGMAGRYPTLNIGLNANNRYNDDPSSTNPGERDKFMFQMLSPYVNLRWTLFNGFAIKITKDKLAYLNEISEGSAAVVVENTIQGIVLAYYKALLETEKLGIVEEILKLSKDRYDYVQARKEVGAAATFDVLQAKIAWLDDTATLLLQQTNVKSALRNLNLILGEPAERDYRITDTFSVEMRDYRLEDLLAKLFAGNKTLKNQYINQSILKKDISLQRSGLFPVVSLNSGIDRVGSRIKYKNVSALTSTSYDYYVNFSVSLNLFNGSNTRRAIANAKVREKIGQLQIEEMKFTLGNVLRFTYEWYEARKQLFRVAEERLNSARLNMEISTDKFKAGAINSFNYRDVQLLYENAALGKLQATYDLIDTHSELMRLTGGIISEPPGGGTL
ncbi:MAG: TolC family protein [bacterium]|nr:TolC family protein [bacterium]